MITILRLFLVQPQRLVQNDERYIEINSEKEPRKDSWSGLSYEIDDVCVKQRGGVIKNGSPVCVSVCGLKRSKCQNGAKTGGDSPPLQEGGGESPPPPSHSRRTKCSICCPFLGVSSQRFLICKKSVRGHCLINFPPSPAHGARSIVREPGRGAGIVTPRRKPPHLRPLLQLVVVRANFSLCLSLKTIVRGG